MRVSLGHYKSRERLRFYSDVQQQQGAAGSACIVGQPGISAQGGKPAVDKKGSAVVSAAIWVTLYDGRSDIFSFGTFFVGNFFLVAPDGLFRSGYFCGAGPTKFTPTVTARHRGRRKDVRNGRTRLFASSLVAHPSLGEKKGNRSDTTHTQRAGNSGASERAEGKTTVAVGIERGAAGKETSNSVSVRRPVRSVGAGRPGGRGKRGPWSVELYLPGRRGSGMN